MADLPLVEAARLLLHTTRLGRPMEGHATLGSTNTRAFAWAAEGAQEGSTVVTEEQTAGRGRHGRTWTSAPGCNLTFSVILRPTLPSERLGLVTLAACVAACDAIETFTAPVIPTIKWPNDVLLDDRKCCGMLLESTLGKPEDPPEAVVLGVGLNVNQDAFPDDLATPATSLLLSTGRPIPRAPLLACLLQCLERRYASLLEDDTQPLHQAYEARLDGLNEPLTLRQTATGHVVQGICRGITPNGALRLETAAGRQVFHAGEVTTR